MMSQTFKEEPHTFLHGNITLLSHKYPPSQQFNRVFKENMFVVPNKSGFQEVVYYLMYCIDAARCSRLFNWPLFDHKSEQEFRNGVRLFVAEMNEECSTPRIPLVVPSMLISPGGDRFARFVWKLSDYAIIVALNQGKAIKDELLAPKVSATSPGMPGALNLTECMRSATVEKMVKQNIAMEVYAKAARETASLLCADWTAQEEELPRCKQRLAAAIAALSVDDMLKCKLLDLGDHQAVSNWQQSLSANFARLREQVCELERYTRAATRCWEGSHGLCSTADQVILDGARIGTLRGDTGPNEASIGSQLDLVGLLRGTTRLMHCYQGALPLQPVAPQVRPLALLARERLKLRSSVDRVLQAMGCLRTELKERCQRMQEQLGELGMQDVSGPIATAFTPMPRLILESPAANPDCTATLLALPVGSAQEYNEFFEQVVSEKENQSKSCIIKCIDEKEIETGKGHVKEETVVEQTSPQVPCDDSFEIGNKVKLESKEIGNRIPVEHGLIPSRLLHRPGYRSGLMKLRQPIPTSGAKRSGDEASLPKGLHHFPSIAEQLETSPSKKWKASSQQRASQSLLMKPWTPVIGGVTPWPTSALAEAKHERSSVSSNLCTPSFSGRNSSTPTQKKLFCLSDSSSSRMQQILANLTPMSSPEIGNLSNISTTPSSSDNDLSPHPLPNTSGVSFVGPVQDKHHCGSRRSVKDEATKSKRLSIERIINRFQTLKKNAMVNQTKPEKESTSISLPRFESNDCSDVGNINEGENDKDSVKQDDLGRVRKSDQEAVGKSIGEVELGKPSSSRGLQCEDGFSEFDLGGLVQSWNNSINLFDSSDES